MPLRSSMPCLLSSGRTTANSRHPVLTISPDASVQQGLSTMTEKFVRHLPVVDGNGVAGMVSIGDVVKLRIESVEREAEDLKSYIATAG